MDANDGREPDEYRGDAVTGEGGIGVGGGPAPDADPYRGDEVTGEGGAGVGDPDPGPDPEPETDGAG